MEKGNELTIFSGVKNNVYCSLKVESEEEKKKLFNTLEKCDVLLKDCIGQEIAIKDIYVEEREKTDEETGELKAKYRTILFDENGQTYATGSYGIYNVLRKLIGVYGQPTEWKESIKVKVANKNIGNGKQTLTLILM